MHIINDIRGSSPRQGTIHLLVLLSVLIVAAIGFSSLQLIRIQVKSAAAELDCSQAKFHTRSALEIGLLKFDPYWRRNLGNGNWLTDIAMETGTVSLSSADPIDNDVKKGDNHPVVLTGIGKQGSAVFMTSVRLEVGPPKYSCLEVSMTCGDQLTLADATLTDNQTVCANDDAFASGSQGSADIEAGSIKWVHPTKRFKRESPRFERCRTSPRC